MTTTFNFPTWADLVADRYFHELLRRNITPPVWQVRVFERLVYLTGKYRFEVTP